MDWFFIFFPRKNYSDLTKIVPCLKIHNHGIWARFNISKGSPQKCIFYSTAKVGFWKEYLGFITFIRKRFGNHYWNFQIPPKE